MAVKFSQFTNATDAATIDKVVGYKVAGDLNIQIPPLNLDTTYAMTTADGVSPVLTLTGTKPGSTAANSAINFSGTGAITVTGTASTNDIVISAPGAVVESGTPTIGNIPLFTGANAIGDSIVSETSSLNFNVTATLVSGTATVTTFTDTTNNPTNITVGGTLTVDVTSVGGPGVVVIDVTNVNNQVITATGANAGYIRNALDGSYSNIPTVYNSVSSISIAGTLSTSLNLGIGTPSPSYSVDIHENSSDPTLNLRANATTNELQFSASQTLGNPSVINSTTTDLNIRGAGSNILTLGVNNDPGSATLGYYGQGNITGAAVYNLAVNNVGKIIEVAAGGSLQTVTVSAGGSVGVMLDTLYVLTSPSSVFLDLPSGPSDGDSFSIANQGVASGGNVSNVIQLAPSNEPIMGSSSNLTINNANASFDLVYSSGTNGWTIVGAS